MCLLARNKTAYRSLCRIGTQREWVRESEKRRRESPSLDTRSAQIKDASAIVPLLSVDFHIFFELSERTGRRIAPWPWNNRSRFSASPLSAFSTTRFDEFQTTVSTHASFLFSICRAGDSTDETSEIFRENYTCVCVCVCVCVSWWPILRKRTANRWSVLLCINEGSHRDYLHDHETVFTLSVGSWIDLVSRFDRWNARFLGKNKFQEKKINPWNRWFVPLLYQRLFARHGTVFVYHFTDRFTREKIRRWIGLV